MRLLIVTQKVDATDSALGFFVRWLEMFSKHAEVAVIANEVGPHSLPPSVRIYSLGKEHGASRLVRLWRYQKLLLSVLPSVDGVFFHMCPEYAIAAHFLPKRFDKKTALWYVHRKVRARLRLAERLVHAVFTASTQSFRLRSGKVRVVGHGIDTELFSGHREDSPELALLSVGRISPVKDLSTLLDGFFTLRKRFETATLSLVGEPITKRDEAYRDELSRVIREHGIVSDVQLLGKTPYTKLPELYGRHTLFVHASRTGSLDKAVLEALASGLPVCTSSEAFTSDIPDVWKFREGDGAHLAEVIAQAFEKGKIIYTTEGRKWVEEHHSLSSLIGKILAFYQS